MERASQQKKKKKKKKKCPSHISSERRKRPPVYRIFQTQRTQHRAVISKYLSRSPSAIWSTCMPCVCVCTSMHGARCFFFIFFFSLLSLASDSQGGKNLIRSPSYVSVCIHTSLSFSSSSSSLSNTWRRRRRRRRRKRPFYSGEEQILSPLFSLFCWPGISSSLRRRCCVDCRWGLSLGRRLGPKSIDEHNSGRT